jgi:type IV secretion system protein VirD4
MNFITAIPDNVFILDKIVARIVSKILKGSLGLVAHVLLMIFVVYTYIEKLVLFLIFGLLGLVGLHVPNNYLYSYNAMLSNTFIHTNLSTGNTFAATVALFISLVLGVVILVLVALGAVKVYPIYKQADIEKKEKNQPFGKARFATYDEVKNAGLYGAGIVYGKMNGQLVTKPPLVHGHTLVFGGSGTGKTSCVAIPTLLSWPGAVFAIDIKGDLSAATAERRAQYGRVYRFNPENEICDAYDPIQDCNSVHGAQELARTVIPMPPNSSDPFWVQSAQAVFAAFAYEGALVGDTITTIARKLCTEPIAELIAHCKNSPVAEVKILASVAYDIPEKTLQSIAAEIRSKLITLAVDPNIARATAKSDWTANVFEENATVYLTVSEDMLSQFKDLWTIIIAQLIRRFEKRGEGKQPSILMLIDELPRLSKIEGFNDALATLRSRNIHIMGTLQGLSQLDMIYGENTRKVIAENCRYKLVLEAADTDSQRYFSELAGQRTVYSKSYQSGFKQSHNEQGAPLVRPEEWAHLKKPILFAPKLQPIEVEPAFYKNLNL